MNNSPYGEVTLFLVLGLFVALVAMMVGVR
jgi:hypothetical protein